LFPLSLFPHQIDAISYLKSTTAHALLWDEQRVGKTAPAIVASGEMGLARVLIVTPVAGVGVWRHQWKLWDRWGRKPTIIPWSRFSMSSYKGDGIGHYDLVILDEAHYAKNAASMRTKRVLGTLYGNRIDTTRALVSRAPRIWCLTGTPAPHDVGDLFPVLRTLFPGILSTPGFPLVDTFERFRARYCIMQLRKIGKRWIKVVVGGQNLDELNRRLNGLFLRRRQSDVGIRPAHWDTMPIEISPYERARMFADIDLDALMRAAHSNALSDPSLAVIRRITGTHKARATIDLARSYFDAYEGEKLVLAYWHKDVGDVLEEGLEKFRPVRVDGSTTGVERTARVARFQVHPEARVFLAQIVAAGEAIDLSASSEMWFVESTFTPAQMAQMGSRITNLNQPKQCLVRVAALEDSVDELIQDRLVDLSRSIAHTLGETYHENFRSYRS
jgi:hypothetical protein